MKTKVPYKITIAWSKEDECFIARVPALPGVSADGDTIDEAAREIEIALEAALETFSTGERGRFAKCPPLPFF